MSCRNCNNDLTLTCGEFVYVPCVMYEGDLPEWSEFHEGKCVSLHDLLPEIYDELSTLRLDNVNLDCLTIEGDFTHQKLEEAQNAEICALKTALENITPCDFLNCTIEDSGLDVSCLEANDLCSPPVPITTVSELIQTIIDRLCALESA